VLLPRPHPFRLRQRSLLRGVLLALGAFAVSLRLAGFPNIQNLHGSPWQILPVPIACWAMVETARCLERRWSLYHAGVLILLYTELMILAMVLFLWVFL
jgi:CO dehydrogenase/acetyl-CoA synthase gamma subunit (corrinoid Fe-S protein)